MDRKIDFDLDDPLGDLLSDKSDDSFFEDKAKVVSKPSATSTIDIRKSNVFALDNSTSQIQQSTVKENISQNSDWLGIVNSPIESRKTPPSKLNTLENSDKIEQKNPKQNLQVSIKSRNLFSADTDNLLNELGLNNEDTNNQTKAADLFDDILQPSKSNTKGETSKNESNQLLGYNPTSRSTKLVKLPSSNPNFEKDKSEIRQSIPQTKSNDSTKTRRETSGRRQKSVEWLELFDDEENEPQTNEAVPFSKLLKSNNNTQAENKQATNQEPADNKEKDNKPDLNPSNVMKNLLGSDLGMVGNSEFSNMMNNVDIEQQSAAICLQHQQSQLMVALQLKAQEESLAALHERHKESRRVQHEVVSAHREQLEQLLKGQATHRTHLHNIMMEHQKRINNHIHGLLKPTDWNKNSVNESKSVDDINYQVNATQEEDDVPKKISEREQLENMIVNIRQNHSKELDIMENSYKHQVFLINESLTSIEEQLKSENENLRSYYLKRIENLETENMKVIERGDEKLKMLQEKCSMEREEIENKHKRDVEMLQQQFQVVINNIRETMELERSTLKTASDYTTKLDSVMKDVEKNNTICADYAEKIDSRHNKDIIERETALIMKENQVKALLDNLEATKKTIDTECDETRKNLRHWEERLYIQSKAIEEEKLILKLNKSELQNEREMFKLEKEKSESIIESERMTVQRDAENMQVKLSEMEKDHKNKVANLNEEKNQLEKQKKSIDEIKQMNEETKRKLDKELNDMKEYKKNYEQMEEKLHQGETVLAVRYQELETLNRSALTKHALAEHKMAEAKHVHQKYEEKMRELQEFAISLRSREQQIARDKMALSRERLMFHNMQKEFQCSVCKTSNNLDPSIDFNKYVVKPTSDRNINTEFHLDQMPTRDGANEILIMNDVYKRSNISMMNNLKQTIQRQEFDNANNEMDEIYRKPIPKFQDIVDPELMLLKLDIKSSTK